MIHIFFISFFCLSFFASFQIHLDSLSWKAQPLTSHISPPFTFNELRGLNFSSFFSLFLLFLKKIFMYFFCFFFFFLSVSRGMKEERTRTNTTFQSYCLIYFSLERRHSLWLFPPTQFYFPKLQVCFSCCVRMCFEAHFHTRQVRAKYKNIPNLVSKCYSLGKSFLFLS